MTSPESTKRESTDSERLARLRAVLCEDCQHFFDLWNQNERERQKKAEEYHQNLEEEQRKIQENRSI